MRTLLILAALTLNLTAATSLCKIVEGWTRLNERLHQEGVTLGQNLAAKLDGDPTIAASVRFQNHSSGLPPRLAAQEEIDGALGAAEEARAGLIGDQGAGEFIEVATTDRVVSSSVSYDDIGRGYGQMAASASDSGVTNVDQFLALVFQQQRQRFQNHPGFKNGAVYIYTEASFLRDWTRLFDTPNGNGFAIATDVFNDLKNGPNHGVVGNIHAAAVLKSRDGKTIEAIDPDRLVATTYQEVDILTPDSMIQVGVSHNTIRDKIGRTVEEAEAMADLIIAMESAHPGKLYKFLYMEGEPSDFALAMGYLNTNLQSKGSSRQITGDDFIKAAWNE